MARPIKNNCDYFPHDRDMRNHKKIKALRTKFGISGYAIWVMFVEYLTGNDGNVFENSEIEQELMAGDFGVSVTEIRDVLNYCILLELLFEKNGFISSESLDERLSPVYEKRGRAKDLSKKQHRLNGSFCNSNADKSVITALETPQSKVKEIKENKKEEKYNFSASLLNYGFEERFVKDWLSVRAKKKASNTETAFNGFISEVEKLPNVDKNKILELVVRKSWQGFEASWYDSEMKKSAQLVETGKKIIERDLKDFWNKTEYLQYCKDNNFEPKFSV